MPARRPIPKKNQRNLAKAPVRARDPGRRARILDVAKRHFAAHGYKGTNLDAIAREAGCAKGALYLEFADKRALLHEIVSVTYQIVMARYRAVVLDVESPLERIIAALRFAYDEGARQPMLMRIARETPDALKLVPPELLAVALAEADVFNGWVEDAIRRGEVRDDIDRKAVASVFGVLKYAPQHAQTVSELGGMPVDRIIAGLIDVFLAGIATPRGRKQLLRSRTEKT